MHRPVLFLLSFILIAPALFGQTINLDQLHGLKMRSIGPAGMSGRVTTIDAQPSNPNVIYVGTASGGLWKSDDGGIQWDPIFDDQRVQSIGAVAIDPKNPDLVWAGTGEGNPRNSFNSGKGIYKSLDGGKSWKNMGLDETKAIHRVIIDPRNSDVVYVAALGSAWGPNPQRGIYKTTDGGKHWEKILYVDDTTGCAELVMDPRNPNKLIAAMWEYSRQPWFFNSGGDGSGLYITHDGGETWQERTAQNGLPSGELGRMGIAIAPSSPNIVYALIESVKEYALYRSTDGGVNWHKRGTENVGNRPFYYAEIYVDPQNENRIYSLWSKMSRSEDGGKSFDILLGFNDIHPDHHALWIHPDNPHFLIDGNDGGLAISRDRGENWQFIHNLPVAQYYHINYDMDTPYNVYGGLQDNGSWAGPSAVWQRGGIRNHHWIELHFGDGFDVVPQPGNSRYGYAMSQGGDLYRYDRKTGESHLIKPVHPEGKELRFNWNAAIAADPFDDDGLYFGSQYLHHSRNHGKSWDIRSPDLTTNDTARQKQVESGGLTVDATKAENFTTITCIAPSLLDSNVIFVGTDDGNVQVTKNGGDTWANVADNLSGMPGGSWIQQIVPSEHNTGEFFVVANNYRRNDWAPYAYHTTDFGQSWKRIAQSGEVEGHCWSIVQDPEVEDLLFLGTDYGLYFSLDKGLHWQQWTRDFPSAPVRDLKIHPREHDLIVATFGRSIFILDDIRPLRDLAAKGKALMEQPFVLFEGGTGWLVDFHSYRGARFPADENFNGTNDRKEVSITFWLKETGKEASESFETPQDTLQESDWEKVHVTILDDNGQLVRNFSFKPSTGLNRKWWRMKMNGPRFPTNGKVKAADDPASGKNVLPGQYYAVVAYGPYSDTTKVTVMADPREAFDLEGAKARHRHFERLYKTVNSAFKAYEQLKEMDNTIERVNKSMDLLPDSIKNKIQEEGQTVKDSIKILKAEFLTPPGFKGYDHVTVRLNDLLYDAIYYIATADGRPGENARYAMQAAKRRTAQITARIIRFSEKDWSTYQDLVENTSIPLFREFEPLIIDD